MRAVMAPRCARGFTLIEALVVVVIMSIMLAIGMPSMSNWLLSRKAMSAAVFYQDGFALARNTAIAHNAHTRLVLSENATSGKMDWRVDLCYPVVDGGTRPCDDNGDWSTTTAAVDNDPNPGVQSKSVQRSAEAMPNADTLIQTVGPDGATEVFFTPLGWVDTSVGTARVTTIDLSPSAERAGAFQPIRVALPLGGIASICNPAAALAAGDVRRCPP